MIVLLITFPLFVGKSYSETFKNVKMGQRSARKETS